MRRVIRDRWLWGSMFETGLFLEVTTLACFCNFWKLAFYWRTWSRDSAIGDGRVYAVQSGWKCGRRRSCRFSTVGKPSEVWTPSKTSGKILMPEFEFNKTTVKRLSSHQ